MMTPSSTNAAVPDLRGIAPDIRWRAPGRPEGPHFVPRIRSGEMFRENAAEYLLHNAQRYGDLVWFRALGREVLQCNHPELISNLLVRHERFNHRALVMQRSKAILGEGLLTSEEPLHMRQRRLAQPAFHRARIQSYGDVIAQCTGRSAESWKDGTVVDIHASMLLLALRIVGKTLFDLDLGDQVGPIATAVDAFQNFLLLAFVPQLLQRLPLPVMQRIRRGREELDTLIYRVIAERRADPGDRGDLLSMLLASEDSENAAMDGQAGPNEPGARMSDEQIRDECLTVLLAGHETTANALSFVLWQVAADQEMQEQLAAEAHRVLGGRLPTAEDYAQLSFTEQVFAEGLRLYPPVWVVSRMAAEGYEFHGVPVRKGTFLIAPQFAVHRDPRFWPDPLRFDPSRFTKEAKASRPKLAYFPFGAGSRQCIGEGLAWMEGVLALAVIVQQWRLRLPDGAGETLQVKPSVTLRPRGPVLLRMDRR